ncbi:MAG: hypothetical protein M1820_001475 [Bogoriella megaspora]|nr:MAG: hypothetical protein M1820_001475 [Bogoriella megaspora]
MSQALDSELELFIQYVLQQQSDQQREEQEQKDRQEEEQEAKELRESAERFMARISQPPVIEYRPLTPENWEFPPPSWKERPLPVVFDSWEEEDRQREYDRFPEGSSFLCKVYFNYPSVEHPDLRRRPKRWTRDYGTKFGEELYPALSKLAVDYPKQPGQESFFFVECLMSGASGDDQDHWRFALMAKPEKFPGAWAVVVKGFGQKQLQGIFAQSIHERSLPIAYSLKPDASRISFIFEKKSFWKKDISNLKLTPKMETLMHIDVEIVQQ